VSPLALTAPPLALADKWVVAAAPTDCT